MTDYKSMFEQAVRTLAAIDEALGIGDDGCGDPDQTLTAIDDLKAAAQRGEALALTVMGDQTSHDHNVTALRIKSEEHKCCANCAHWHKKEYIHCQCSGPWGGNIFGDKNCTFRARKVRSNYN